MCGLSYIISLDMHFLWLDLHPSPGGYANWLGTGLIRKIMQLTKRQYSAGHWMVSKGKTFQSSSILLCFIFTISIDLLENLECYY